MTEADKDARRRAALAARRAQNRRRWQITGAWNLAVFAVCMTAVTFPAWQRSRHPAPLRAEVITRRKVITSVKVEHIKSKPRIVTVRAPAAAAPPVAPAPQPPVSTRTS